MYADGLDAIMNISSELAVALAVALPSTILLEAGFFLLTGKRNKKDLMLVILVNVLTNPAVVLIYWLSILYTDIDGIAVKALLEILAVLVEGLYYKQYAQDIRKPFLFSLGANAFSFFAGVLIQLII